MELARQLARTGSFRADRRSPDWFGYALAKQLNLNVAPDADSDPKDLATLQAIIRKWLENKVLAVELRKDDDRKERRFIVPGPFKPDPPATPVGDGPDDE